MKKIQLIFVLFLLLISGQRAWTKEVPNGDADVIWSIPSYNDTLYSGPEYSDILYRWFNDAVLHPINGNIIAACNHEIWELDINNGQRLRKFEEGQFIGYEYEFWRINITPDGKKVLTGPGHNHKGILIWDYETGKIIDNYDDGGTFSPSVGAYPDNTRCLFFSENKSIGQYNLIIYDFEQKKVLKKQNISPRSPYEMVMSKDGKYILMGLSAPGHGPDPRLTFQVELWDAETLTMVKRYAEFPSGSDGIMEVRISNNNQYIAFRQGNFLHLHDFEGTRMYIPGVTSDGSSFNDSLCFSLCFSNDSKKIIVFTKNGTKFNTNIYDLATRNHVYQYSTPSHFIRTTTDNKLLLQTIPTTLYSNKWYLTDVKSEPEATGIIKRIEYINNAINIELHTPMMVDRMIITDIEGRILNEDRGPQPVDNRIKIEMILPSGNYILKLISQGKEYTNKFVIVR